MTNSLKFGCHQRHSRRVGATAAQLRDRGRSGLVLDTLAAADMGPAEQPDEAAKVAGVTNAVKLFD